MVKNWKASMPSSYEKIAYQAPSNIAFVKYWGKHGRQLPMNPSLSMTLSKCISKCEISYSLQEKKKGIISFLFEGKENILFQKRLQSYLDGIEDIYPLASELTLKIQSENTFPHSAGIASSASAMAAFSSCLAKIEERQKTLLTASQRSANDFKRRSSVLARLASGSACRSIYGQYALWGKTKWNEGSDEYASPFTEIHHDFLKLCDSVLIVSSGVKEISSSLGHSMMNTHLYKEVREHQAHENMRMIVAAMKRGDYKTFGEILESEALTLQALMMTSFPSFLLLAPNSIRLIELIKSYRKSTDNPVYFTVDAGPNIHLIYPKKIKKEVVNFITRELLPFCETVIHDEIGVGAREL